MNNGGWVLVVDVRKGRIGWVINSWVVNSSYFWVEGEGEEGRGNREGGRNRVLSPYLPGEFLCPMLLRVKRRTFL